MPITRTIYTASRVSIDGGEFLVKSFNLNSSKPFQQIEEYGNNNFHQVQSESSSGSCDIEIYPVASLGASLSGWAAESRSSDPTRLSISSNYGGLENALLSSIKFEASIGSIPTVSLNFIGKINTVSGISGPASGVVSGLSTTENIIIDGSSQAQRLSLDWNIPILNVVKYDEDLNEPVEFFGNPVGVCNVNLTSVNTNLTNLTGFDFAGISVSVINGQLVSSGINQAVDQIAASYNVSFRASSNDVTFA